MADSLYSELTYYLRGLGFRIHGTLKGGHNERVYEEALVYLMEKDGMPYIRQQNFVVGYKGHHVGTYRPDLMLADGDVTAELKAVPAFEAIHRAQTISYLAVTGAKLGFLMNFGATSLETERLPNRLEYRRPLVWQPLIRPGMLYPEISNAVMGCTSVVHHTLGPGFVHQVYRAATRIELELQGIKSIYLAQLPLRFESTELDIVQTRLFCIEDKILLATYALTEITARETERMRWAMCETDCHLGIIANFYPTRIDHKFIRT